MISSLPILDLTFLAQLEVLYQFSLPDLLIFSLLSEQTRLIAKEIKLKINSISWKFCFETASFIRFESDFESQTIYFPTGKKNQEELRINGASLSRQQNGENCLISMSGNNCLKAMEQLTEHIFNVFKVTLKDVNLHVHSTIDLPNLFIWKYAKKFTHVLLTAPELLLNDDVEFLLEGSEVECAKLEFSGELEHELKYNGPLKMEILKIEDSEDIDSPWLTIDSLLNMECRRVYLTETYMEKWILNKVIKHWIQGGLPNLEYFEARIELEDYFEDKEDSEDYQELLGGIEAFPWDSKNRPKVWENEDVSSSRYVDFRGNNGKLATVRIGDAFSFRVWP